MTDTLEDLKELFGSPRASDPPVRFRWRLLKRKGQPFLLLPSTRAGFRAGLEMYPAQRVAARLFKRMLQLLAERAPARVLPVIETEGQASAPLVEFLSRQVDVSPKSLASPAVFIGRPGQPELRFVLLGYDREQKPVVVIKAATREEARRIIDREAGLLARIPESTPGVVRFRGADHSDSVSAFAMAHCAGTTPDLGADPGFLMKAWALPRPRTPITSLPAWLRLESVAAGDVSVAALRKALADQAVLPVLSHGDFTPWNVRVSREGQWTVIDWERGELDGIPGWDWFHYLIQIALLVRRQPTAKVVEAIEVLIGSRDFRSYADQTGLVNFCRPLVLAYLLYQIHVIKPGEGLPETEELARQLVARWQLKHPPGS